MYAPFLLFRSSPPARCRGCCTQGCVYRFIVECSRGFVKLPGNVLPFRHTRRIALAQGFVYNSDMLDKNAKVKVDFGGIELVELLEKVLSGRGLTFEINQEFVILMKTSQKTEEQKKITITGIVKDKQGEPLIGVTVLVKGTSIGVVTDTLGKYKITLPERKDLVLVYSFVGMQNKEVKIVNQREVNVVLEEDKVSLDDVVVTGYATVKKSSFTGNSVKVDREDLLKVSSSNVVDILQVFDPSLRIMRNNEMGSDPNTVPEFYIRGRSGIGVKELDASDVSETALKNNPNLPLFIMDGFEVNDLLSRSEEHTSELQFTRPDLVCRLLLEKN